MVRTSQQTRKDLVNLQRLVKRLENGHQASPDSNGGPKDTDGSIDAQAGYDYYQSLGLLSSIRYARTLLDNASSGGAERNSTLARLGTQIDALERRFNALHQSTSPPALPTLPDYSAEREALRPKIDVTSAAVTEAETSAENSRVAEEATIADELLSLGKEDIELKEDVQRDLRVRRRSSQSAVPPSLTPFSASTATTSGTRAGADGPSNASRPSTQSVDTLLSHHRSEQDTLTSELVSMAKLLKNNSIAFSGLLDKDKQLISEAEEKLDKNLSGMTSQGDRLKSYSRKGGVTLWFTIGAVIAVCVAWFLMFALMRVA